MGGGPLEEEFRVWADKKANVFYLGYVPHEVCMAIAERADFALMPSIWYEGCSMVAIETESLGIPLITTDIGFFKEAIQNGKNGIKIPLGDIQGFREAIMNFWENPEKVQEMGQNARTDYEKKYVPEDNVKQLLEIYVGVLGEDGKWSK